GVDENLYTEQVYSEDLYIDPKIPVDNTESFDNQEVNSIENFDDHEISVTENLNNSEDEFKLPEDEYDFLNFSD
ncbi:2934_t:CDS:1, partial [Racocetra persica]